MDNIVLIQNLLLSGAVLGAAAGLALLKCALKKLSARMSEPVCS